MLKAQFYFVNSEKSRIFASSKQTTTIMEVRNTKAETICEKIFHSIVKRRENEVQLINQNFLGILEEYDFDIKKEITIVYKNNVYFRFRGLERPSNGYIKKVICVDGVVKFFGYNIDAKRNEEFTAEDLCISDGTFFEFVKVLTNGLQELRNEEEITITLTRTQKVFLDKYITNIGDLLMDGDEVDGIKIIMKELDITQADNDKVGKMLNVDWCC